MTNEWIECINQSINESINQWINEYPNQSMLGRLGLKPVLKSRNKKLFTWFFLGLLHNGICPPEVSVSSGWNHWHIWLNGPCELLFFRENICNMMQLQRKNVHNAIQNILCEIYIHIASSSISLFLYDTTLKKTIVLQCIPILIIMKILI